MSRPAVLLVHDQAGCVEPIWLGVRAAQATPASTSTESGGAAPLARAPFAPGTLGIAGLELETVLETRGVDAWIHLRARNVGSAPLRLDALALGLVWRDHGVRALRTLRHGWQSWSFTGPRDLDDAGEPVFPSGSWLRGFHHAVGDVPADRAGWHESDLVTVVGAARGGPACLVGVCERGNAFGIVYSRRREASVEAEVELRIDATLAPGAVTGLETVRISLGTDASALLEEYALDYGRRAGARVARPFVAGWCSWYYAFERVSEDDVRRNLEALERARDEIPVDVVQLDDGYQRAVGDWRQTNAKFPRGLAPIAEEIRAAGFVPGLWTAPFCVVRESELFAKQPAWLLGAEGAPFRGMLHPDWTADAQVFVLDASRPEVEEHLVSLFRDLVAMGFHYLKLDFLFVLALSAACFDPSVGRAARLRRGLEAVRRGAGEEAFLLGCGSPLGAAVGVVDGMRIGPDVAPHWDPDPARAIPGIEATLPSTRSAVRNVLGRAWMHRRLWQNDPDCLMVRSHDTGLSAAEREALATAIAVTGGACVFSDDLPALAPGDRALLRSTLVHARAVDVAGIPGGARVADPLASEIPERVTAADASGVYAAVVNPGDDARDAEIATGDAGRTRACLGPAPARDRVRLEPHGASLFRTERDSTLVVFCDFDGTFSVQDVGATLAQRYIPERRPEAWARFEKGEIGAWEYNLEILDGMPVPLSELDAFLRSVALDPGARDLLAWCDAEGVPFRILSDGFDWNLNRLQVIHRVRFAYTANGLRYEDGRWRIRAGAPNPDCGCGTGVCKRGIIEASRAARPGATLVHIGNGRVSDTCGALAADVAFAKDSLAPELERRGAAFEPFETLHDVLPALQRLLG